MGKLLIISSLVIVLGVSGLLLTFGTATPCGILRKEMKKHVLQSMESTENSGITLALSGSMVDARVDSMSPLECVTGFYNLRETQTVEQEASEKYQRNFAQARNDLHRLNRALSRFRMDAGRYPELHEGLKALHDRPEEMTDQAWKGPYLETDVPLDPWGRQYIYYGPNPRGRYIECWGADGQQGGTGEDADIIW